MSRRTIALVGDYSEKVTAHRAIPVALGLARESLGADVAWEWVATRSLGDVPRDLAAFSGVWLVPASPYENMQGALDAVRLARESGRPFLGTCGGFQHALIEFARNVAGLPDAGHAETDPNGSTLVISRLSCSLVEKTAAVRFAPGSLLGKIYGAAGTAGEYRCNYGINTAYEKAFESAGMTFTAWDEAGEIRGAEIPSHPFFAGVLFQPERTALKGEVSSLVRAFVKAVCIPD